MQKNITHYSIIQKICLNYHFNYKTVAYNWERQSLPYGLKKQFQFISIKVIRIIERKFHLLN